MRDKDTDTDDSDEELGAMIYSSSHTAKKFREEAERIKESELYASSKNTKLKRKKSPSPSPTSTKRVRRKCSINGCTNNVVKGGVCKRHGASSKK